MMRVLLRLLWLTGLLSMPVPAFESPSVQQGVDRPVPVIVEIAFLGNHVTREQILRQEMVVHEGDPADPARIEQSRQAIMNLGLFQSVHADTHPRGEGVLLVIAVKEKYYILPVPKLNRDDYDNFTLGAELTLDNLGGYNQQLKLRYETEEAAVASGGEITSYQLSYRYPRILGGPWQLQTELTKDTGPADGKLNDVPTWQYAKQTRTANFVLSRWINQEGPSQGWQVGGGMVWRDNVYDFLSCYPTVPLPCPPPTALVDSTAVGVLGQLSFTRVADFLYSRQGVEYGYNGEYGATSLGSDTRYTRHEIYWRYYHLLAGREHENVDIQTRLGLSSGELFQGDQYSYVLGGSKSLRAYETSSAAGNAFLVVNIQYLRPLFGYNAFRGVIFLDVGNTFPSNERIHLGKLLWDVGVGLRFRLKSFVKIDLRADVSYSPDIGETRAFFGSKEMF